MADPKELTRLIQQLQRVSSPLQRAKMLSRAWRSLRRLSPAQRRALADQVGIADGADLIEKLASRKGGVSPTVVQRALDAVGDRNVGDLRKVIGDLRDPERRKTLVRRGFEAAADSLAGPEDDEAPDEQPATEAEAELPAAEPVAVPGSAPPATPTAKAPKAAAVTAVGATVVAAVPPPAAKPVVVPVATEEPPVRPPKPVPKPAPPPVRNSLLDRVGAETMISTRFRTFRENLDEARGLNARQLRDLLDLFPSGWGQRRVLGMLFEQGIPGSVNQAIFLIEHLDSTMARRWCVKTLLASWSLSAEEREALVERHAVFRVAAAMR